MIMIPWASLGLLVKNRLVNGDLGSSRGRPRVGKCAYPVAASYDSMDCMVHEVVKSRENIRHFHSTPVFT